MTTAKSCYTYLTPSAARADSAKLKSPRRLNEDSAATERGHAKCLSCLHCCLLLSTRRAHIYCLIIFSPLLVCYIIIKLIALHRTTGQKDDRKHHKSADTIEICSSFETCSAVHSLSTMEVEVIEQLSPIGRRRHDGVCAMDRHLPPHSTLSHRNVIEECKQEGIPPMRTSQVFGSRICGNIYGTFACGMSH
jgi:hypothetical protein